MSLHYIFWHWPRAGVDLGVYAGKLVRFQEELENYLGTALLGETASFRSPSPPWTLPGAPAFSDWYAMDSSTHLDAVNDGAVSGAVKPAHDEIAALYGGGAGSLYDYKAGTAFDPAFVRYTHWFAKPAGMSYGDLYTLLDPVIASANTTLLRRRMVLGPSPEFCIASAVRHELPRPVEALVLEMTRL